MKVVKINNTVIKFFDSSKEIGFRRFQTFNKYFMISCAVGSTFSDYDARMSKALQYLSSNMIKEGIDELENQRQCVYSAFSNYNPKHSAFAVLVHSIDNNICGYESESEINTTIKKLEEAGVSEFQLHEIIEEIKKKLNLN